MMEFAGKDADNMFEDIGHSKEARNTMQKWVIGKLKGGVPKATTKPEKERIAEIKSKGGLNPIVIFVLILAIVVGLYFSQQKK